MDGRRRESAVLMDTVDTVDRVDIVDRSCLIRFRESTMSIMSTMSTLSILCYRFIKLPIVIVILCLLSGFCNKPPVDDNSDSVSVMYDSDTSSSSDMDRGACLASISGQIRIMDAEPTSAAVIVCIGSCFAPVFSSLDGTFVWNHPMDEDIDCVPYDFNKKPLHIDLRVLSDTNAFAEYAFVSVPSKETISDKGESDFDLDIGELFLFALPSDSTVYQPSEGAVISTLGLTTVLEPGVLVKFDGSSEVAPEHEQEIRVFKAPLEIWTPPFVDKKLSALYFISPRWARLKGGGVSLTIDAPEDFEDNTTATIYLLGGYDSYWGDENLLDQPSFIYVDELGDCVNDSGAGELQMVEDGIMHSCGQALVKNRKIVTPPIPRFTWIGIGI